MMSGIRCPLCAFVHECNWNLSFQEMQECTKSEKVSKRQCKQNNMESEQVQGNVDPQAGDNTASVVQLGK